MSIYVIHRAKADINYQKLNQSNFKDAKKKKNKKKKKKHEIGTSHEILLISREVTKRHNAFR